jgi:hypothetical protein
MKTRKHIHDDENGPATPPGLPAELPEGERQLWQGKPDWRSLAIRAFHVRKVAIYFAALMAWRVGNMLADGAGGAAALREVVAFLPFAVVTLGVLALIAWGYARVTTFTITTKRVVLQTGISLNAYINLPYARIDSAGLHVFRDGTGDIPLRLTREDRIAVYLIWPFMRPWRITHPQPMLRGVPDAANVGAILAAAMAGQPTRVIAAQAMSGTANQAQPQGLRPAM